jgi:DNA-binding transcriptional LysR family regulator
MMQTPDWNDLACFLAVARAGTLAGAARALSVNHSTVFRRLNRFEAVLGVRLFERLPEGYALTEAGEALLPRAERVAAEIDAAARELFGRDARLEGPIRVTTATNLATSYLARYLPEFARAHPGVHVELVVGDENRDLSRREADVALRATSDPPEHLVGREIVRIGWSVFGSAAYRRRHGAPHSMDELEGHRLIRADPPLRRLPAFAWAERHLPSACFVATSNDLTTMAALAIEGLALAILPDDQRRPRLERLFETRPAFSTQIWLLTHPDLRGVARIRAFMDFVAERLRADERLAASTRNRRAARAGGSR